MAIGGTKIADMTVGLHFDGSKMYIDMKNITKRAEAAAGNSGQSAGKAFSGKWAAAMGVVSGIASSAFSKISSMISSSMSGAINRMDTMNNFPKVMQSLGYAADEASGSVSAMADHLDGLPTTLDEMVSNTQQLAASMGNLNKGTVNATSVGLAFNDMMLAGGKGTETASRAFVQYNQMLSKGKVDMQSWNSLVEAAPGQMNQLAESILGAGKNQRDLYQAIQNGTVSFDQMNAALVKLDKEGGAGFASFNEQAIAGTEGLQTQLENVRTSITKVVTAALQGQDMAKPIEQLTSRVRSVAKQLIPGVGRLINGIVQALPQMLTGITDVLLDFVPDLIDGFSTQLPVFVQGLINFFVNAVQKIVPQLPRIFLSIVNGIIDTIKMLTRPENIKAVVQAAIDLLMGIVKAIPDILIAIIEALPDIIIGIVEFLTDPENIGMIIKGAVDLFMGIVMAVPRILGKLVEAIGKLFDSLWKGIQDTAVSIFNSLPEPIQQFFAAIYDAWTQTFDAMGQFFSWVSENVFPIIGNIVGAIAEAVGFIGNIIGTIANIVGNVLGVVFNIVGTILGVIVAIVTNVIGFIVGIIQGIVGVVANIIGAISEAISNVIGWISETFSGLFEFIGGIFKGIGDVISGVADFIGGIFKGIADFVGGIFQGMADFIGGIFEAIGGIIKAPINAVINIINGVLSFINSITIPDWVPGIGGWHADIGMIPTLAQGGIAGGATTAIIGEAGKEAVLPLERNTDNWSGLLASALAEEMAAQDNSVDQRPTQIIINNEINSDLDARNISQVVEQAMRRAAI